MLEVVEEAQAKLQFGGYAFNAREAQPYFAVTSEQWAALAESPLIGLTLNFIAEDAHQSTQREVKPKHAERIMDAINCLAVVGH